MKTVLQSHLKEGESRKPVVFSAVLHLLLLLFFTFGVSLLPEPPPIELGMGPGGGQGDFVSVGLAADTGGGAGMYKAPITSRPESAPPPPEVKPEAPVEEESIPEEVFTQEKEKPKPKPPEPERRPPPKKEPEPAPEKKGLIPRESDPGKGAQGGSGGSGGGFGTGKGVLIGSGSGEGGSIDSWYVRQVEQRVGQNWLQTSLGRIERRVEAVATFVVQANGQITDVQLESRSGVSSVDLAVMRAIHAANPLPPLPLELRNRTVRFRAVFEYPPR